MEFNHIKYYFKDIIRRKIASIHNMYLVGECTSTTMTLTKEHCKLCRRVTVVFRAKTLKTKK